MVTHARDVAERGTRIVHMLDGRVHSEESGGPAALGHACRPAGAMMSSGDVRLALQALRTNWLRGMLTALGVIIGVASLVALTAISAGARADLDADLSGSDRTSSFSTASSSSRPTARSRRPTGPCTGGPRGGRRPRGSDRGRAATERRGAGGLLGPRQASPFLSGITPLYQRIHNYGPRAGGCSRPTTTGSAGRSWCSVRARPTPVPGADRRWDAPCACSTGSSWSSVSSHPRAPRRREPRQPGVRPAWVAKRVLFGGEKVRSASSRSPVRSWSRRSWTNRRPAVRAAPILPGRGEDFGTEDQTEIITTAQAATSTFQTLTLGLGRHRVDRRRHRDHEHHARLGDRADTRDRHPQGSGSRTPADPGTVPHRGARPVRHRRSGRRPRGGGQRAGRQRPGRLADVDRSRVAARRPEHGLRGRLVFGFYPARRAARLPAAVAMRVD